METKDNKKALDNIIIAMEKALEKHKDKESTKEAYERIQKLKDKRNLN